MGLLYAAFSTAGGKAVGNLAHCAVAALLREAWRLFVSLIAKLRIVSVWRRMGGVFRSPVGVWR